IRPGRLRRPTPARTPELLWIAVHLAVDGPGSDAEEPRGQRLVAAGVAERLADQEPLDLLERHAQGHRERPAERRPGGLRAAPGSRRLASRGADRSRKIAERELRLAAEHHRSLDGVLELAHVAGPGVGREGRKGLGGDARERLLVAPRE